MSPNTPEAQMTPADNLPVKYDDAEFDTLYKGQVDFDIKRVGRTMTLNDLEKHQKDPQLLMIREHAASTVAILVDKKTAGSIRNRMTLRALVSEAIQTLDHAENAELWANLPLKKKAANPSASSSPDTTTFDPNVRPHAMLLTNTEPILRASLSGARWMHFHASPALERPVSLGPIPLPLPHPNFIGTWYITGVAPKSALLGLGNAMLNSVVVRNALNAALESSGCLLPGRFSWEGLVAGLIGKAKWSLVSYESNGSAAGLINVYLPHLTSDIPACVTLQRAVAALTISLGGLGDLVPFDRPMSCTTCYECDHFKQDCDVANSPEYKAAHPENGPGDDNAPDLAPAPAAAAQTNRYRPYNNNNRPFRPARGY